MVLRSVVVLILCSCLAQVQTAVLYPERPKRQVVIMGDDSSEFIDSSAPIIIPYPYQDPQHFRVRGRSLGRPSILLSGVKPEHYFHHHQIPDSAFFDDDCSSENLSFLDSNSEDFKVDFSDDNYTPNSFNFMDMSESVDSSEEIPYGNPYVNQVVTLPRDNYPKKVNKIPLPTAVF